jgi:uncharacterized YccA/Bax inhibitor family protein
MLRSGNPALSANTFSQYGSQFADAMTRSSVMTLQGTVWKTAVLLVLCICTASVTWGMVYSSIQGLGEEAGLAEGLSKVGPWIWGGAIGGIVFALITIFAPKASPYTAPLYALAEGLFLGGISAMFNVAYEGIVLQAVMLTFGVLGVMLFLYATRIIKPTENFKLGVVSATSAIFLIYLATWILRMFDVGIPFIHDSGLIGIGFSLFVVVIASLNLVLDFDFIETGAEAGAPKHMEWYGAFGLMITLVWLYLEILRLLAKLRGND